MAVTLKRKRGAVSYREPSSDEDLSESDSDSNPSRTRATPVRRSGRHRSTEAEQPPVRRRRAVSPEPPTRSKATVTQRGSRRARNERISYRDASSEDEDEGDDDFEVSEREVVVQVRPQMRNLPSSRSRQKKTTERRPGRPPGRSPRKSLGAPLKAKTAPFSSSIAPPIPTDGHRPNWASLPYHVLLQIFVYAAHPLHDENMVATPSISWLVQMARMCSAFTKPALTALYRNPPIHATRQNRKELVQRLMTPSAVAQVDYRVMVKRLELDAIQMASSKDPLHDATNLASLVAALTTVKEIDIFDPFDRPPYRARAKRVRRWYYPDELFDALRQSNIRLYSWRWNSSFCANGFDWIKEIHDADGFQSIRELTFTKFSPTKTRKSDDDEETEPTAEELMSVALSALPNLKHLAFESCDIVNERLLPLLPATLLSLSLVNCIYVTSDSLQDFLSKQGHNLEELVLNHCQSLNLSFLPDLRLSCPRLEILRMDLNYYSSLVMSSDNEPIYDYLLDDSEIPTWPSTLRVIDMQYLRHWSAKAAINLFDSLIDSAKELPQLRELRILAMVDIDWRERATFRAKWAARFVDVFARRYISPNPHLASLRAYRESKTSSSDGAEKNDSLLDVVEAPEADNASSDSDVPLVSSSKHKHNENWNSRRLRTRARTSANYDESSGPESGSDDEADAPEPEPDHIQGQCHTVVFRIDNLRPREDLYDENDFLDEERSGDEDWTGNDVVEDDYAW